VLKANLIPSSDLVNQRKILSQLNDTKTDNLGNPFIIYDNHTNTNLTTTTYPANPSMPRSTHPTTNIFSSVKPQLSNNIHNKPIGGNYPHNKRI